VSDHRDSKINDGIEKLPTFSLNESMVIDVFYHEMTS
jgi:hypothetical protein